MPAILDIEFPFGVTIQQYFCPVCGEPVLVEDFEAETPACPHVDWVYLDDVCEFLWLKPEVAKLLDQIDVGEEDSQGDEDSDAEDAEAADPELDALIRSWDGKAKAVFVFTTGGIACGPVWSTIRIGFDFSIPPVEEEEDSEV